MTFLNKSSFHVSRSELVRGFLLQRQTFSQPPKYSIHRLLKWCILQDLSDDSQKYLDGFHNAVRLVRGVVPCLTPYTHKKDVMVHRDLFARYITHIRSLNEAHDSFARFHISVQDLDFATLLSDSVLYLLCFAPIGSDNLAQKFCEKAIKIRSSALGENDPDTLASKLSLVSILERHGRLSEAMELTQRLVNTTINISGQKRLHPQRLIAELRFASIKVDEGDFRQAVDLLKDNIASMTEEFGPEHPYTLEGMGKLSVALQRQGKWWEATDLSYQVRDLSSATLGPDHPDTLTSIYQLAMFYQDSKRWEKAERLALKAFDSREKILGPTHPDTMNSLASLVLIYRDLGKLEEAEKIAREVWNSSKEILGTNHPDTLNSYANLASICRCLGKLDEAEQLAIEVLNLRKQVLGTEHPSSISSMEDLALIYLDQGHYPTAEVLQRRVLRRYARVLGKDHLKTIAARSNLSRIRTAQARSIETKESMFSQKARSKPPTLHFQTEMDNPKTHTERSPLVNLDEIYDDDDIDLDDVGDFDSDNYWDNYSKRLQSLPDFAMTSTKKKEKPSVAPGKVDVGTATVT